jgi:hypothetical protein
MSSDIADMVKMGYQRKPLTLDNAPQSMLGFDLRTLHLEMIGHPLGGMMDPSSTLDIGFSP